MKNDLLVVVKCSIGEVGGWRVVGVPRDEPDVSIFQEYDKSVPVGWSDYGIFHDRDEAISHAKNIDYLMAAAASFEAGQKGS